MAGPRWTDDHLLLMWQLGRQFQWRLHLEAVADLWNGPSFADLAATGENGVQARLRQAEACAAQLRARIGHSDWHDVTTAAVAP